MYTGEHDYAVLNAR